MSTLNVGKVNCTGNGVKLPSKTTGTLPTGETGLLVFDTTVSSPKIYNGTAWTSVGGATPGGSSTHVQYNSGSALAGSANLTFDGTNLTCGGNVIANSDERIKDNITTIINPLEKVTALRGVSYTRRDNGERQIGVIAQEVEAIIPEVVTQGEDGIKGVAYGNIVGLLIEAIKQQQKEIDELKAKLA
jgi:hypothetical protein